MIVGGAGHGSREPRDGPSEFGRAQRVPQIGSISDGSSRQTQKSIRGGRAGEEGSDRYSDGIANGGDRGNGGDGHREAERVIGIFTTLVHAQQRWRTKRRHRFSHRPTGGARPRCLGRQSIDATAEIGLF